MGSSLEEGFEMLTAGLGGQLVGEQLELSENARLVCAARGGDRAAFGLLYDQYARMVHGIMLAKAPIAAVDDLVQDVFVLALRRLSTLREVGSFGAWLAAIARNLAKDHYRRSAPEEQLAVDVAEEEIEMRVSRGDQEASANLILDAIKTLPDAYREPLILRLVEGMTGPEIAARTGLTAGSVRVNLHRGMQQLRAILSPNPGRPGQEGP
jgi:RNA polymerase sigma-70 factor (ECF subfamily)